MIEGSQDLRFAFKPRQPLRIGREQVGQDFQRDLAAQLHVPGAVDLTHAARAEGAGDFVRAEASAGLHGHGEQA